MGIKMIKIESLVNQLLKYPDKVQDIDKKIRVLNEEKTKLKNQDTTKVYENITLIELEKIWNNADQYQRFCIAETNDSIEAIVDHLAGHGGLTPYELFDEITREEWGESEWIEDMNECFEEYCKESEENREVVQE
jgi:hypothetical protein